MKYSYPSKQDESWRRTDPELFKWPGTKEEKLLASLDMNGAPHRHVHCMALEEGLRKYPLLVRTAANERFSNDFSRMVEESAKEGYVLFIERPVRMDSPVSLNLKLAPGTSGAIKNVIYVAPATTLTVVEEIEDPGGEQLFFSTRIVLAPGAKVDYRRIWGWDRNAYGEVVASLGERSELRLSGYHENRASSKIEQRIELKETGSAVDDLFVSIGEGRSHLDFLSRVVHSAPSTCSNLEARSVLDGAAYSVHHGLIQVERSANGTRSYFSSRNLLLAEGARADSIPKLEIATDEVSAGHGATVSTVDPEAVFYMMTRGLTRSEAERTFVEGFLSPLYMRMPELVPPTEKGHAA